MHGHVHLENRKNVKKNSLSILNVAGKLLINLISTLLCKILIQIQICRYDTSWCIIIKRQKEYINLSCIFVVRILFWGDYEKFLETFLYCQHWSCYQYVNGVANLNLQYNPAESGTSDYRIMFILHHEHILKILVEDLLLSPPFDSTQATEKFSQRLGPLIQKETKVAVPAQINKHQSTMYFCRGCGLLSVFP